MTVEIAKKNIFESHSGLSFKCVPKLRFGSIVFSPSRAYFPSLLGGINDSTTPNIFPRGNPCAVTFLTDPLLLFFHCYGKIVGNFNGA